MPFHSTTIFTLAYLLPRSLAHLPQQKKHYLNMLSSKTNALLTHTLASFWRKQSCFDSKWTTVIDKARLHYTDVIMTTMTSQITSLTVVYSTVYWNADQRKHQSFASLAFVWGIQRDRWIPRTKGQLRGKCFHLMTSSWKALDSSFH